MSVLNFLSDFFVLNYRANRQSNRLMFVEEFCVIQLICLEKKSHVYLDKVFLPYTPNSFFSVTVLHSLH